ncbi:phosphoribosylanthranilate isomerase [Agaribacter marinus]|uniref:N-(5'-phosphoribosyl)anthranilate isomerase n=1 Tax=Virgibacillus salarius TaxID=447199 RepID=A0A941DTJ0_9BACI|nr:phosphoribosylanthranilate isomerase [Virgibacillus salarius]MBR7796914.1 phosphoribosylanthranilate isomerase [Virgibacillus salarius]NAZ09624.1 phosphoribosylanthranilate isomerase [Agaribacter marinus]
MHVKICGIQSVVAALAAVDAGADFIGFVFAKSKRSITPEAAADIVNILPRSVKTVGVFVNERLETMNTIASQVPLNYIQLHGEESAAAANKLNSKIIKAYPVDAQHVSRIEAYPCDFYLLDGPVQKSPGGNGVPFDWNLFNHLPIPKDRIMIAGGLTPENVGDAIRTLHPYAVDVSSGVETNGNKDPEKIKQFIANAKRKDEFHDNLHNA